LDGVLFFTGKDLLGVAIRALPFYVLRTSARLRVHTHDPPGTVQNGNGIGCKFEQASQHLFALPQRLPDLLGSQARLSYG